MTQRCRDVEARAAVPRAAPRRGVERQVGEQRGVEVGLGRRASASAAMRDSEAFARERFGRKRQQAGDDERDSQRGVACASKDDRL